MYKIRLSKSKYTRGKQCKKMLWMDINKPIEKKKEDNEKVLKDGNIVGKTAKKLFGEIVEIEFNFDLSKMIERTKEEIEKKTKLIGEASFSYDNTFCSVDLLKNDDDGVEIYEIKSSGHLHDIFIEDVSYQYYILSNLGYNIKKACVVHLNSDYIRHGELNIKELFTIEDITEIVIEKQEEVKENIEDIKNFISKTDKENEPDIDIGMHCSSPYNCEYWDYCTRNLPKPNVFDIHGGMHKDKKFEKYYEGKISFEDLQNEELNEKYLEQIDFELNNREPKIEVEPIKELMDSLKYPLYFIDFETFQPPIPEYEGTKSYQQIPFQYSLHIARQKDGILEHKEFLAEIDDDNFIRHFAESMIKDIDEDGSVIVYNEGFEHTRINELIKMFPDLKEDLERINNNMVDFLDPFSKRQYYTKEMQGSASIKKVLPALYPDDPELDYHNLPVVHNGEEASATFLSLRDKTKEEQKEIREGLLKYCELDTYAMVKIWEKFKEVIKEK